MISEISLRLLFFAEFAREILQRGRLDQRDETRTRSGKKYVINNASTFFTLCCDLRKLEFLF